MTEVITPAEEAKNTDVIETKSEVVPDQEQPAKAENNIEEKSVGEVLNPIEKETISQEKATVPLSTFLEMKKETKSAQKQINDLKKIIEDGASKSEIIKGIKEIANEHNVDENFLQEFASTVKAQTEQDIDEKIASKLRPYEEKTNNERIDKTFNSYYDKVLETMPEYKGIINKDVIKSLSLDVKNKDKTFNKIIEEAYGHLITGKRTIETSMPRGGKDDNQTIDYSKIQSKEYFTEVMNNPVLKEKYNQEMMSRLSKSL